MKFQVGDEVRVLRDPQGVPHGITVGDICEVINAHKSDTDNSYYLLSNGYWYREGRIEKIVDHDVLMQKVLERNNKPKPYTPMTIEEHNEITLGESHNPIQPAHYNKGEIDLFESAYRTRPFNEFRAIMEFVAERYMKRDKENRTEDLDKAIYTLERLKEYEELEEEE